MTNTEPKKMGRPKGSKSKKQVHKLPNGGETRKYNFSGWLQQATPGDEMFTTIDSKTVFGTATRLKYKIQVEHWTAIHTPTRQMEDLIKVKLISKDRDGYARKVTKAMHIWTSN